MQPLLRLQSAIFTIRYQLLTISSCTYLQWDMILLNTLSPHYSNPVHKLNYRTVSGWRDRDGQMPCRDLNTRPPDVYFCSWTQAHIALQATLQFETWSVQTGCGPLSDTNSSLQGSPNPVTTKSAGNFIVRVSFGKYWYRIPTGGFTSWVS